MRIPTVPQTEEIPGYLTKLVVGLLLLTLTLLLLFTAVTPFFNYLFVDEMCKTTILSSGALFSATATVPDCWLIS